MIVLRLIGTVLWFAVPAWLLTTAIHDLAVRDAPTYSIEGTVVAHRQVTHPGSGDDPTTSKTYFVTVREAGGTGEFEFGSGLAALDTEPGTPVVVRVSQTTHEIVLLRRGSTVVDLRPAIGDDVTLIVLAGIGLLIALTREFLLEDYDIPRWAGLLLGMLATGGGVYVALEVTG